MSPRMRRGVRWVLVATLLVVAAQQTYRHGWDYVLAEQFHEVEPGRLYRSAWLKSWPLARVIREHQIRTIVALAHPPDHPLVRQEREQAEASGVRWVHLPIVDDRDALQGRTINQQLDTAVAILADPEQQPVLFHCHHGINRASMLQIAYRTKIDGWSLEEATAEVAEVFGLRDVAQGPDYRHMVHYYRECVLPSRHEPSEVQSPGPDADARSANVPSATSRR